MILRFTNIEMNYTLAVSTLLDPRFKKVGFGNASGCSQAVQRLTSEVASIIASNNTTESTTTKADEPSGL